MIREFRERPRIQERMEMKCTRSEDPISCEGRAMGEVALVAGATGGDGGWSAGSSKIKTSKQRKKKRGNGHRQR